MGISSNRLFELYKKNDPEVIRFFQYPLHPDWSDAAENVLSDYKNHEFLKILSEQNKDISNPEYLDLVQNENTVVLVTGQQLGLFVSPLYTIYKILTVILYAKKLTRDIQKFNFIPVFWLEGEDHDFEEINHAAYFNQSGQFAEVVQPEADNENGFSISKRNLPEQILDIIAMMNKDLLETEFSLNLFNDLKNIWKPGQKWNKAFAEQVQLVFKDMGLLIFNPADENVKKLSIPFFKYLIENNDKIVGAFDEQSRNTESRGFENQVFVDKGKSYIFLSYQGKERVVLQKSDSNHFTIKDTKTTWDKSELLNILKENPEWFSSTVLTRPVWQSWMLPVVSYIAGPAEIAYWAQLKIAFNLFDVQMPHVLPRLSYTILEPKIQRLINKYLIDLNDIPEDSELFVKEQLRKTKTPDLENEFNQIKVHLSKGSGSILSHVESIDPTLESVVKKTFESASNTIEKLENRILRRVEEIEGLSVKHFKEIHENLFPNGSPQERVISSIYFLNKYGPDWLNKLIEQTKIETLNRQIITL